jgi:hypothetical protein
LDTYQKFNNETVISLKKKKLDETSNLKKSSIMTGERSGSVCCSKDVH